MFASETVTATPRGSLEHCTREFFSVFYSSLLNQFSNYFCKLSNIISFLHLISKMSFFLEQFSFSGLLFHTLQFFSELTSFKRKGGKYLNTKIKQFVFKIPSGTISSFCKSKIHYEISDFLFLKTFYCFIILRIISSFSTNYF